MLYAFELGREFKLSLAELFSFFDEENIEFVNKKILILDIKKDFSINSLAEKLGGTIKIFKLEKIDDYKKIYEKILLEARKNNSKFNYSLNIFGIKNLDIQKKLIKIKKFLKENKISSRFANKNNFNLSSAQILGNKLIEKGADFNLVNTKENIYFGKTIWVQDINSYSKRDFSKKRDMQIGMLPVKLSQIMINISSINDKKAIYDPFVGLGTILIEGAFMGINNLFGSDFNPQMIETSTKNLNDLKQKFSNLKIQIFELDARDTFKLDKIENLNNFIKNNKINIITEGFLGEIMTKKNINLTRIEIQRKNLKKLYEKFFAGLKKINFSGNIVISFPFWELDKKYFYFEEIYEILDKYCKILEILPKNLEFKETKSGSLLYKRDNQLVGREIFKLKIK